jgi:hypothetical protein
MRGSNRGPGTTNQPQLSKKREGVQLEPVLSDRPSCRIESRRDGLLRFTSLQEIRPGSASLSLSVTSLLSRLP